MESIASINKGGVLRRKRFRLCRLLAMVLLVAAGIAFCPAVYAEEMDTPPQIQEYLDEPEISAEEFSSMSLPELIAALWKTVSGEFLAPFRLLGQIGALLLLASAALTFAPSDGWRQCIELIAVAGCFLLSADGTLELVGQVSAAISDWRLYLASFLPIFAGVMVSCGQSAGALVCTGLFFSMASLSAQLICGVAMPLVRAYLALNSAAGISGVPPLQEATQGLTRCVRSLLRGVSVGFAAVLGLQNTLAAQSDNLAMRAGGAVLSSSIPVVGAAAQDAMASVLAGLRVVKGSLGFAAIAVLAAAFLPLFARCLVMRLVLAAGGLLAKAFGLPRSGAVLEGAAEGAGLCLSFLVFFFMLVVLSTALMIATGTGGLFG